MHGGAYDSDTDLFDTGRKKELAVLSSTTGKKQAELVREAVDQYIVKTSKRRKMTVINRAAGTWADRNDLPDFDEIRRSVDREGLDA